MIKFNFTGETTQIGGKNNSEQEFIGKKICDKCKKNVNRLYAVKVNGENKKLCVECKKNPND